MVVSQLIFHQIEETYPFCSVICSIDIDEAENAVVYFCLYNEQTAFDHFSVG